MDELLELTVRPVLLEAEIADYEGGGRLAYEAALKRLAEREGRLELFGTYPGLALGMAQACDHWVGTCEEFFERLAADWPSLVDSFRLPEREVTAAWLANSDPHDHGRRVIILRLRGGARLVYKPRAIAAFAAYQQLLRDLNEAGFTPQFEPLTVLDRDQWGWTSFATARGCRRRAEVEDFYRRLGGHLALLQLLGATDCHHENIVAAGEHPHLIDLETLLTPQFELPTSHGADGAAVQVVANSVLRTGLLPSPEVVNGKVTDLSGLGAMSYQETALTTLQVSTDDEGRLRVGDSEWRLGKTQNRPRLNGREANPEQFTPCIAQGFNDAYRMLLGPTQLVANALSRFNGNEVRVVLRPTAFYAELLRDSRHPNALYDGAERDRILARVWETSHDHPWMVSVADEEFRQLRRGDVPLFRAKTDGVSIHADVRTPPKLVAGRSGLSTASSQIARMGESDRGRQVAFIGAAVASLSEEPPRVRIRNPHARIGSPIDLAREVGERLLQEAVQADGEATWIVPRAPGDDPCPWLGRAPVRLIGSDLYGGLAGIVVFLSHLYRVSGDDRFSELAEFAARTIRRRVDEGEMAGEGGAFNGLSGASYALSHLAFVADNRSWHATAAEWAQLALSQAETSCNVDLISGLAGALLVQLGQSSPPLGLGRAELRRAAERLRANLCLETPSLPYRRGASHGYSGAVWALAAAAAHLNEPEILPNRIVGEELKATTEDVWLDPGDLLHANQASWCHGPTGIALCRLAAARAMHSKDLERGALAAVRASRKIRLPAAGGLCHGLAGVLEMELFLDRFGATGAHERVLKEAERLRAALSRDLESGPNVLDPGLMTGLAGIGLQLLRLADPATPSVLLLEPPQPQW